MVKTSHGALSDLIESKSAQRLSRKVTRMISQMDDLVTDLNLRKEVLLRFIFFFLSSHVVVTILYTEFSVFVNCIILCNYSCHCY